MSGWIVRPAAVLLLSTALGAGQERGGALHVTLDQTACRAVDEIGAYHITTSLEPSGVRSIGKTLIAQGAVTTDCAWNSGEVEPGEYEVWFQHKGVKVAIRAIAVAPGQTTEVALKADVVVAGFVSLNGAPFEGITARFSQKDSSRRKLAEGVTDAAGNYQVFLADEGPYTVTFWRDKGVVVLGQDREGTAQRGNNRTDWLLEGGTLTVTPVGWDRLTPISLWIERKEHTGMLWYGISVHLDTDRLPLTLIGLGLGTYELHWVDTEQLSPLSQTTLVTIDAQNREPSLQLAVTDPRPHF